MNELIKINYESDRPTVLARDLHEFLEVETPFNKWFSRMCEYGFTDGADFQTFLSESTGGRPATDAQLTIDMAKEICMLQRNEKGKQARQYFLQLEREWNSPEAVMSRALRMAEERLERFKTIKTLTSRFRTPLCSQKRNILTVCATARALPVSERQQSFSG